MYLVDVKMPNGENVIHGVKPADRTLYFLDGEEVVECNDGIVVSIDGKYRLGEFRSFAEFEDFVVRWLNAEITEVIEMED